MNVWKEISNNFERGKMDQRRMKYFRWLNGLDTQFYTYSEMNEEEFIAWLDLSEIEYRNLKKWESTAEYKRLTFLLKEDEFATDLLEIYNATKELALQGDSQAIKNTIMLQDEIKEYRKSIDEFEKIEEEGDGLVI